MHSLTASSALQLASDGGECFLQSSLKSLDFFALFISSPQAISQFDDDGALPARCPLSSFKSRPAGPCVSAVFGCCVPVDAECFGDGIGCLACRDPLSDLLP